MINYLHLIEEAIRNKQHSKMGELITKYLKSEKYSKDSRFRASEFYRRISEYSKALELLRWQNESFHWRKLDQHEFRIRLQSIRLLNLLGASSFAVRMLDTMDHASQMEHYELIAPIYLSNGRYSDARRLYQLLEDLPESELDYPRRLRLIGLAEDSFSGLGDHDRAIRIAKRILKMSAEPAIIAILNEAVGSYYLQNEDIRSAKKYQSEAQKFFQPDEKTNDHGFLLKWIGARLIYEKKFAEAKTYLDRSFEILFQRGTKPEAWLEVLYWKGFLKHQQGHSLPDEWKTLLVYPSYGDSFRKKIEKHVKIPSEVLLNHSSKTKAFIHFKEDMFVDSRERVLGLNLPQKLTALLSITGSYGIPFYRACDSIWSDGLYSFESYFKRLDQGLVRLRKEGVDVEWKEMHVTLIPNARSLQIETRVNLQSSFAGRLFFDWAHEENCSRFTRENVEKYFSLSRNRAAVLCKKWTDESRVTPIRDGRQIFYGLPKGLRSTIKP